MTCNPHPQFPTNTIAADGWPASFTIYIPWIVWP